VTASDNPALILLRLWHRRRRHWLRKIRIGWHNKLCAWWSWISTLRLWVNHGSRLIILLKIRAVSPRRGKLGSSRGIRVRLDSK
jgi:hypothetical protein